MRWLLFVLALTASLAGEARDPRFTVQAVDTRSQSLELFLDDEAGRPFHRFERLDSWLQTQGRRLRFAMNAGMFQPDYSPVGLFVSNGRQRQPLNLSAGKGNFFLEPNGVFLLGGAGPRVVESSRYPSMAQGVRLATQSGPLLLRAGRIHPSFNPQSQSRLIRNGVGVRGAMAYFVISEQPVSFHEFAVFFRDELRCADALYLDGTVSGLYSRELARNDARADLGPMIAVVEQIPRDRP
ncbi:hypothetical protein D0B54_10600 [Solimonas sp. K1W22B-7]|nr:hypothetical protein D0B54_10600 [Solimonas sp. K1W22B-7]